MKTLNGNQPAETLAFLSLGSNLGDRAANLNAAIDALGGLGHIDTVSSFYETEPVEYLDQPEFLNCVLALRTQLPPEKLMQEMLLIERQLGRDRSSGIRKGPRVIDLDLLLYGDRQIVTADLQVPHPAMHLRRFVLEPLAEIAPEAIHPIYKKTVRQLLGAVGGEGVRRIDKSHV